MAMERLASGTAGWPLLTGALALGLGALPSPSRAEFVFDDAMIEARYGPAEAGETSPTLARTPPPSARDRTRGSSGNRSANGAELLPPSGSRSRTLELPGGEEMKFIWIAPGTFTMGSQEPGYREDPRFGPPTRVTLTEGFWLGETELTVGDWKAVGMRMPPAAAHDADHFPIRGMSRAGVLEYSKAVEAATRAILIPPTSAQWEYACRAGTEGNFFFLSDPQLYAWEASNSGGAPHPVATKLPNQWGLYDMAGNVRELTRDTLDPGVRAYPGGSITDPSFRKGNWSVGRGSSYNDEQTVMHASWMWTPMVGAEPDEGVRLVLLAPPP